MSARIVLALVFLLALAPAAQARPNILVLMTDDQTLDSMSVMPKTRELIGERGSTFTRSFASYSLCCPSRATLYTGQYAHNHGVLSNMPPSGGYTRLDTSNWLPLWLQAAGYRTMHVGKFLNGYGRLSPPTAVPPGFDDWHGTSTRRPTATTATPSTRTAACKPTVRRASRSSTRPTSSPGGLTS